MEIKQLVQEIMDNPDRKITKEEAIFINTQLLNKLVKEVEDLRTRVATLEIRTIGHVRLGGC